MKILLVFNFFKNISGENVYFTELTKLLRGKKQNIILYTKNNEDIKTSILENFKITHDLFWSQSVFIELSKIIERDKPDIAHFNNVYPLITPTAYHVCKKFNLPIVQSIHNYRYLCPKGTLFRNNKICELCVNKKFSYPSIIYGCYHNSRLASTIFSPAFFFHKTIKSFDYIDTFIFPTKFIRDYHVKHFAIPKYKTRIIPNFVNNTIKPLNAKESDYFLFVGRLSEEKGIIQLLDIFASLPQFKLIVIGDGPLREKVARYKQYTNIIIKNVLSREKIFGYMKNALFTIIPSLWYEVLPMVLIESLFNGTPVIVPRFGSFIDLVQEGKNGVFFQQNNFEDLKENIMKVYKNKLLIQSMRKSARKEYMNTYTGTKHCHALLNVYQSLV